MNPFLKTLERVFRRPDLDPIEDPQPGRFVYVRDRFGTTSRVKNKHGRTEGVASPLRLSETGQIGINASS